MNKYERNLSKLNDIYEWAKTTSTSYLEYIISKLTGNSIVVIGSGGSYTVASLFSELHTRFSFQVSQALTPLEYISHKSIISQPVIIISARGNNNDILSSFKEAINREPPTLVIICGKKHSKLATIARKYRYVDIIEFEFPISDEGFLSVQSLFAFSTILIKSYINIFNKKVVLPTDISELNLEICAVNVPQSNERELMNFYKNRDTIIILYGKWGKVAAIDFESKFAETGLAKVLISDYRNFGHGRHYWLFQNSNNTIVIALEDTFSFNIAQRTINLLPTEIPFITAKTSRNDVVNYLTFLYYCFQLVKLYGKAKNIDPSKPGVPEFGRRLYRLRIYNKSLPIYTLLSNGKRKDIIAIFRKNPCIVFDEHLYKIWHKNYNEFIKKVQKTNFKSIVFDYDGTICDTKFNKRTPSKKVLEKITELTANDFYVGIATGRGDSVRKELQQLIPKDCWSKIIVGYRNGGTIGYLHDEIIFGGVTDDELKTIDLLFEQLLEYNFDRFLKIKKYKNQLTLFPTLGYNIEKIMDLILPIVTQHELKLVASDHSVDVIPKSSSKVNVVNCIKQIVGNHAILCIGDNGKYPGNDYELLMEPYSLSTHIVSNSLTSCWNLAPIGYKYSQATEYYLNSIHFDDNYIYIHL